MVIITQVKTAEETKNLTELKSKLIYSLAKFIMDANKLEQKEWWNEDSYKVKIKMK